MDSPEESNKGYYKLTTEDYENIWLRIKDKTNKRVLHVYGVVASLFTILTFVFGSGLYFYGQKIIDSAVTSYIKSQKFEHQAQETFKAQFNLVDKKLRLIDKGLDKLAIYKSAPYSISDHGFTLVDSSGNYVIVEHGSGSSSDRIEFKSKFSKPPTVVALAVSDSFPPQRERPLAVMSITNEGFSTGKLPHLPMGIKWIAIGK